MTYNNDVISVMDIVCLEQSVAVMTYIRDGVVSGASLKFTII